MGKIIEIIRGLSKTMLLNFYYFDFKTAIHFPIIVGSRFKILSLGDRESIVCKKPQFGVLRIGLSSGSYEFGKGLLNRWSIENGGRIEISDGPIYMNQGAGIYVGPEGKITFKGRFFSNANCLLSANRSMNFGNDTLIGWNCSFIDGDGHKIKYGGAVNHRKKERNITIGDHVWIGAETTVLKGVEIGSGSVIAMRSHVTKSFGENVLIAGNSVVRENIEWEH